MRDEPYFTGQSGQKFYYRDIADRVRIEAPEAVAKHISEQLEALGLYEEMMGGNTPFCLPYSFSSYESNCLGNRNNRG